MFISLNSDDFGSQLMKIYCFGKLSYYVKVLETLINSTLVKVSWAFMVSVWFSQAVLIVLQAHSWKAGDKCGRKGYKNQKHDRTAK